MSVKSVYVFFCCYFSDKWKSQLTSSLQCGGIIVLLPLPSPVHHEHHLLASLAINIRFFSLNPKNKRSSRVSARYCTRNEKEKTRNELTFVQTNEQHQQQHDVKKLFNCGCLFPWTHFSLRKTSFRNQLFLLGRFLWFCLWRHCA